LKVHNSCESKNVKRSQAATATSAVALRRSLGSTSWQHISALYSTHLLVSYSKVLENLGKAFKLTVTGEGIGVKTAASYQRVSVWKVPKRPQISSALLMVAAGF
jgi:hypothetical protein